MGYHLQSFETLLRTLSEYLNLKDEQCLSLPREAYLSPELHALELDNSGTGNKDEGANVFDIHIGTGFFEPATTGRCQHHHNVIGRT
jgi:hypothetical protein